MTRPTIGLVKLGQTGSRSSARAGTGGGLITASSIGASNRARVLNCLVEHGPLSRAQLARLVRVPRGSVAPIVAGLLSSGALVEQSPRIDPSQMGKPPIPLWFGPRIGYSVAVQIQADLATCALVDQQGVILDSCHADLTATMSQREVEDTVIELAKQLLRRGKWSISGVGLVWPAVLDPAGAVVVGCTPLPQLVGSNLVVKLSKALNLTVLPEDDARALAIGQRWFGEAKRAQTFTALQISTGIGAGIVIDGELLQIDGHFPEVGHMIVDLNGELCQCGQRGCWESIASVTWLRRQAEHIGLPGASQVTPGSLLALGTPPAMTLLAQYAKNIAVGIANLAICLGTQRFLLHGEVVSGGDRLATMVREQVSANANLPGVAHLTLDFSNLNQRAGLLGAAALPLANAIMNA